MFTFKDENKHVETAENKFRYVPYFRMYNAPHVKQGVLYKGSIQYILYWP